MFLDASKNTSLKSESVIIAIIILLRGKVICINIKLLFNKTLQ